MKIKTVYEWKLEVVDANDDILDIEHGDHLECFSDEQLKRVIGNIQTREDFGALGMVTVRLELAVTKRRYECLPTFNAQGQQGEDILDLLDIGYAYIGREADGELPSTFDEAPGRVPSKFLAQWEARAAYINSDA
jgi:hypothetical protein